MGFNLKPIKDATKTFVATWEDTDPPQSLTLTYKPAIVTPAVEDQIREAAKNNEDDILIDLLLFVLVEWDVLDLRDPDQQTVLDLNDRDAIKEQVPSSVIKWMIDRIGEDRSPKAKKPATLRRGSLLADGGDPRRNGIRP